MFKVILLPVDIGQTEAAKTAIAAASQLMQSDTKLVLLNVVDEVPAYIATQIPKSVSDQVNEDAKAALDKLVSGTNCQEPPRRLSATDIPRAQSSRSARKSEPT